MYIYGHNLTSSSYFVQAILVPPINNYYEPLAMHMNDKRLLLHTVLITVCTALMHMYMRVFYSQQKRGFPNEGC